MRRFGFGGRLLLLFGATVLLAVATAAADEKKAEPKGEGVYVTVTVTSGTFDLALGTRGAAMEQARGVGQVTKRFPLGTAVAVIAQAADASAKVTVRLEIVKSGKDDGHVSASGASVAGFVTNDEQRASGF